METEIAVIEAEIWAAVADMTACIAANEPHYCRY